NSLHFESSTINTTFLSPVSEIRDLHESAIQSIDISCSGNLIVSSDTSGSLIVSNVMNGSLLVRHQFIAGVVSLDLRGLVFSPNMTGIWVIPLCLLAFFGYCMFQRDLKGHIMDVYKCRFFPSGLVVLSAGMDMSVRVWSVETGQCPRIFKGHTMAVTDLAIIGVGREVLSCSNDGTIIKWLCADGSEQERWRPEAGPCNAMSIDRKSEVFAVACESKKCMVYSVEGPTRATISTDNVPTAVCIDHELDNVVYIGDEEGMVSVYDTKLKSYVYRLQTNRGAVMKMMTRDEGLFAAFKDGSICCYLRQCPTQSNISCPLYEFTGSDCDPIYDFCFNMKHLFTASRDRIVRKYRIP
ncbi:WD domain, G-beta repeat protein, partial [Ancylostoma caninum]